MRVDINNDVNYLNNHVNPKTSTTEEEEDYQHQQSEPPLSDPQTENSSRSRTIEDWDVQLVWSRMMREVNNAKIERRQELQELEVQRQQIARKWQELNEEKQNIIQLKNNIDQQRSNLEAREAELQSTIPLAKQLLAMKIDITNFLP
jgi:DNA repair exonuclease SbcCD ATPase subunit